MSAKPLNSTTSGYARRVLPYCHVCVPDYQVCGKIGIKYQRKGNNSVILKDKNSKNHIICTWLQQT